MIFYSVTEWISHFVEAKKEHPWFPGSYAKAFMGRWLGKTFEESQHSIGYDIFMSGPPGLAPLGALQKELNRCARLYVTQWAIDDILKFSKEQGTMVLNALKMDYHDQEAKVNVGVARSYIQMCAESQDSDLELQLVLDEEEEEKIREEAEERLKQQYLLFDSTEDQLNSTPMTAAEDKYRYDRHEQASASLAADPDNLSTYCGTD